MKGALKVFKALSDETRLRMLVLIDQAELCVCEVMQILGMGQSRVSRHLNILKDAGLLDSRRRGTWVFYHPARDENSPYCAHIAEILKDWIKNNDLVKADRAILEKYLADRNRDRGDTTSDSS